MDGRQTRLRLNNFVFMPDALGQKRELYRQQMASKIGQPLPARPFTQAATPESPEDTAGEFLEGGSAMAAQLRGAQAQERKKMSLGDIIKASKSGLKPIQGPAVSPTAGLQAGSSILLKFMWLHIYYVVPLFYIDLHFFLRYLCGLKALCRFGEEWLGGGKSGALGGAGKGAASLGATAGAKSASTAGVSGEAAGPAAGGEAEAGGIEGAVKTAGSAAELVEIIVMILCNLIVGVAIFVIITFIYFLVHPCALIEVLSDWAPIVKPLYWLIKIIPTCKDTFQ